MNQFRHIFLWCFLYTVSVLIYPAHAYGLEQFLMGVSNPNQSTIYLYLGKQKGFFAHEGIDLKLVLLQASIATSALIAQQVDGMVYAPLGLAARSRGAPVTNVFFQAYKPGWFLMSQPEISKLSQLPGKTVSIGTHGGITHRLTVELLKQQGVDPSSVIFIGGRGSSQHRLQMLVNRTVQVTSVNPPFNFEAEKQGFSTLLFFGDYFDVAQNGIVVHESTLTQKRSFLKRFLRAALISHRYTLERRDETVKWIINNLKMDRSNAEKLFEFTKKVATKDGIATEAAVRNAVEIGSNEAFKSSGLVNYSVLQEILGESQNK